MNSQKVDFICTNRVIEDFKQIRKSINVQLVKTVHHSPDIAAQLDSHQLTIPARSGSKGLKDKNIKDLNGKPLIAYSIEAAKGSGIFDEIIVSTDSQKYADIATKYEASVPFLRPVGLASDTAGSIEVIEDVLTRLKEAGKTYDYFMLLQPTSPLRKAGDIKSAVKLCFEKKADSIVSVCESDHSPLLMNTLDNTLNMENFISSENHKRRQDFATYYRLNGAIYLAMTDYFLENRTFYGKNSFAFIMDKKASIDIEDEVDFELARIISSKY